MEENSMIKKMENLNVPEIPLQKHKELYRATLLNTRKSAWLGMIFLFLPLLFLVGALMRNNLEMDSNFLSLFYDWVTNDAPDSDRSLLSWLIRFTLVGGPVVGIAISLMGIVHLSYNKTIKEIIFSIKLRWLNIAVILFCASIFLIYVWVLLIENINH